MMSHYPTQLENFTANQLAAVLRCDLPGNNSHSKMLWKMLLTKLSYVLDPALDILANMVSDSSYLKGHTLNRFFM